MNIKKNDIVEVVTGDDAGSPKQRVTGRVLRVLKEEGKIVVEGINKVYRHMMPSRRSPQGGRLSKEMPIDVSNAMLVCPTCRRGVRTGKRYTADGRKERFCKKCKGVMGVISKQPNPAYARKDQV